MDLTVAICMYNAERYIEETLQCLMAQTVQDFHLMIVNDCSTDGSVALVERFFTENPRQYELVNFDVNQGLCAGRRYVEENAKTKYILFVDADDCPYPTLVEKLYNKIVSDEDLMAVGCYLEYMDSEGKSIKGGIFLGEKTKADFYAKAEKGKLIFMQPTAIYDREVALSVGGHNKDGFPEGKPRYRDLCEDLDLWTRMSDLYVEGKAIVVVPEVLCRYRKHQQAMSTNAIGMVLRMRHIKTNVRRRRRGEGDLTFVEFYEGLSVEELMGLRRDAAAADALRNAVFYLHRGNVVMFVWLMMKSVWYRPGYLWNKVRHNLIKS
jgi:glycosyltransferase involved in cell wall biosynthesis